MRRRWAVSCTAWSPSKEEWITAVSYVQREEKERIGKFVFVQDAKLALVGRLLIRAALTQWLGIDNRELCLGRTEKGRPILLYPKPTVAMDFNISHQGKYAVFAMESGRRQVGVDIMQLTSPRGQSVTVCNILLGGQSVPEFFHTMRRQFTATEWERIKSESTEPKQLAMFYRFWCLKESFIKAEGSGLSYGLQRLEFQPDTTWPPPVGGVCLSTKLAVDNKLSDWIFEESLIDVEHCVSVALEPLAECEEVKSQESGFSELTVRELLLHLSPLE